LIPLFDKAAGALTSQVPFRSLKRNYFFSAVSAVVAVAYPIVTMAYVARALGPEFLGKYYFASSFAAYFIFVAAMGIPVYGNREVGQARGNPEALNRVFSEIFTINFCSNLLVALVYGATVVAVPELRAEARLFAVMAILFLGGAFNCDFLFAGLERQDVMAYRSMGSKALGIVGILALVHGPEDYVVFSGIVVSTALLNSLFGLGALRHWAGWKSIRAAGILRHLRPLVFIGAAALFINVYTNLDSVLLGFLSDSHQVGLYAAVMKPCRLIILLVASLTSAALPRIAWYLKSEVTLERRELQRKTAALLLLIIVPAAASLLVIPEDLARVMYGPQFVEAAPVFRIAALLLLVTGMSAFYVYQVLMPMKREREMLYAAMAGAAASVLLNLVLIPFAGYVGAAWAAVAAESVALCVMAFAAVRIGREHVTIPEAGWKYPAAAIPLVGVLLLMPPEASVGEFLATGMVAAAAYGLMLWLLRERFSRIVVHALLARLSGR
jgi:O-antigen/teichoic acid export membrane protein